jgi:sialate O-acetylesterase
MLTYTTKLKCLVLAGASLLLFQVYADVKMPAVFSDHMVLQRNTDVNIFGEADPREKIKVTFAGKSAKTAADKDGKWLVQLPAMKASSRGKNLTITAKNKIVIKDVLVGEVWHANGQSNMEWELKNMKASARGPLDQAKNTNIRFYNRKRQLSPKGVYNDAQLEFSKNKSIYKGGWEIGDENTAGRFSAVAYIFAQALYREVKVPVAILCTAAGGSPTEAFISHESLMTHKRTAALVKDWPYSKECSTPQAKNNFKNVLKEGEKIKFGKFSYHHPWEPSILFDTGIKPLIPYTINGAIWYQGETNQKNPNLHNLLFPMMVKDWRKQWNIGNFPVYYVQLPSVDRPTWPVFRDGQRKSLYDVDNIGMAVTIDTGDVNRKKNVHPSDKIEVGERLAYLAIQNVIKKNQVLATGPLIRRATAKNDTIHLEFDYAEGLKSSDGQALQHFQVAGKAGQFVTATATIQGNGILLSSTITQPTNVRYCWNPFPMPRPNFVNALGHAASPFEIEIK